MKTLEFNELDYFKMNIRNKLQRAVYGKNVAFTIQVLNQIDHRITTVVGIMVIGNYRIISCIRK